MNKFTTSKICRAGIIASAYFVLTYFLQAISFGPIQARVAEAFTVLPLLFPEAVPALFVGCFLSNLFSGYVAFDLFLGSLATLIAGILTYLVGKFTKSSKLKFILGVIPPILVNALIIPLVFVLGGAEGVVYGVELGLIALSQSVVIIPIGGFLYGALSRLKDKNPNSTLFR